MLVVIPAFFISGIVLLAGSRHLPREMALMLAKLRATPSRRLAVSAAGTTRVREQHANRDFGAPDLVPRMLGTERL